MTRTRSSSCSIRVLLLSVERNARRSSSTRTGKDISEGVELELVEERLGKWLCEYVGGIRCGGGTNDVCKFLVDKVMDGVIFDMDVFDVRVVEVISGEENGLRRYRSEGGVSFLKAI